MSPATLLHTGDSGSLPSSSGENPYPSGQDICVCLIGMPGSGKTTLAKELARQLSWGWLDTDHLLQAWFGLTLESLKDSLSREDFLRSEQEVVLELWVRRCVVATGGSVIYSPKAMRKLQSLGPVVYLRASLETITSRVAQSPQRGLIMDEGEDLEALYAARTPLYEYYADLTLDTDSTGPQEAVGLCESVKREF